MNEFAKLSRDRVRKHWEDEARDFTPWLADNIDFLEDVLNLNLEVVDTERTVGRYSLDILARDTDSGRDIVIENQLKTSDHDHVGKAIAYAAGVNADIIVWISPEFYDEHIDAVQWLNNSTEQGIDFFGIKLEVLRIGDSPPAPQLTPVEEPSEWKDRIREAEEELTKTEKLRLDFWSGLRDAIREADTQLSDRKPTKYTYYGQPMGRQEVKLEFWIHAQDSYLDTRLVVRDEDIFNQLEEEREQIESELGKTAEWIPPAEDRKRGHIKVDQNVEIQDEALWPEYYNWFIETGEQFRDVFYQRINRI